VLAFIRGRNPSALQSLDAHLAGPLTEEFELPVDASPDPGTAARTVFVAHCSYFDLQKTGGAKFVSLLISGIPDTPAVRAVSPEMFAGLQISET